MGFLEIGGAGREGPESAGLGLGMCFGSGLRSGFAKDDAKTLSCFSLIGGGVPANDCGAASNCPDGHCGFAAAIASGLARRITALLFG